MRKDKASWYEYLKEYRQKNKAKMKEIRQRYHATHVEKHREYSKNYGRAARVRLKAKRPTGTTEAIREMQRRLYMCDFRVGDEVYIRGANIDVAVNSVGVISIIDEEYCDIMVVVKGEEYWLSVNEIRHGRWLKRAVAE